MGNLAINELHCTIRNTLLLLPFVAYSLLPLLCFLTTLLVLGLDEECFKVEVNCSMGWLCTNCGSTCRK